MSEFLCDDCMKHLPDYPNNYFDLAIVDPPYGLSEHGGRMRSGYVKQKNGTMSYVQGPYYTKKVGIKRHQAKNTSGSFSEFLRIRSYSGQIILNIRCGEGELYGTNAMMDHHSQMQRLHIIV